MFTKLLYMIENVTVWPYQYLFTAGSCLIKLRIMKISHETFLGATHQHALPCDTKVSKSNPIKYLVNFLSIFPNYYIRALWFTISNKSFYTNIYIWSFKYLIIWITQAILWVCNNLSWLKHGAWEIKWLIQFPEACITLYSDCQSMVCSKF